MPAPWCPAPPRSAASRSANYLPTAKHTKTQKYACHLPAVGGVNPNQQPNNLFGTPSPTRWLPVLPAHVTPSPPVRVTHTPARETTPNSTMCTASVKLHCNHGAKTDTWVVVGHVLALQRPCYVPNGALPKNLCRQTKVWGLRCKIYLSTRCPFAPEANSHFSYRCGHCSPRAPRPAVVNSSQTTGSPKNFGFTQNRRVPDKVECGKTCNILIWCPLAPCRAWIRQSCTLTYSISWVPAPGVGVAQDVPRVYLGCHRRNKVSI
jgi:hypothetical protein